MTEYRDPHREHTGGLVKIASAEVDMTQDEKIAQAIRSGLVSENVSDSNGEDANVVDTLDSLANAARRIAYAIAANAAPGTDATGGHVESLTEAVMGITAVPPDVGDYLHRYRIYRKWVGGRCVYVHQPAEVAP